MDKEEFLNTLQTIMLRILQEGASLNESFVLNLLEQGYDQNQIEQALTTVYNIMVASGYEDRFATHGIRVFDPSEYSTLGSEWVWRLQQLQYMQLANAVDLEILVQGFHEVLQSGVENEDEEFWNILYHFREDLFWYLRSRHEDLESAGGLN